MSAAEVKDFKARLHEIRGGQSESESQDTDIPPAPSWPAGVLPPEMEDYSTAQARSISVPAEMIEAPMIVFAGSTIGNRLYIALKRGWNEYPTLWAGVVSPPGTAKTPATLAAQWPMNANQSDLVDLYKKRMAEYEADLERWTENKKGERGAKPVKPQLQHLYTSDVTIEALVGILSESQGVAIVVDELLSWIGKFDAYRGGKGGDRQQYLSLWSGSPIKADRKGAESVYCPYPVGGLYGGIQHDMMHKLHDPNGGRDGLVERVLLFDPDVKPARWTDDDVDPELLDPVKAIYSQLHTIGSPDDRFGVKLSADAKAAFTEWYDDLADQIEHSRGLRRGFLSKMPSQVARIALVLNTLWNLDDPQRLVSEQRMLDAIAIGEYFIAQLDRVLPLIGDTSRAHHTGLPGRIIRIVRRESKAENDWWIRRSVITKGLGNVQGDVLTEALGALETEGTLEKRTVKTATKPAEEWRFATKSEPDLQEGEVVF